MIWEVEVCRISVGFRTLQIEADTRTEARGKALDEAGDYEFPEKESRYEISRSYLKQNENEVGKL